MSSLEGTVETPSILRSREGAEEAMGTRPFFNMCLSIGSRGDPLGHRLPRGRVSISGRSKNLVISISSGLVLEPPSPLASGYRRLFPS
jgi:hypothetical protein